MNTEQKHKDLQDILTGRMPLSAIVRPTGGTLFVMNGKVYAHDVNGEVRSISNTEQVDLETYKAQLRTLPSHIANFVDFSKGDHEQV